jgi:hypothetical protein
MELSNNVSSRILKTSNIEISYSTGEELTWLVTEYAYTIKRETINGWMEILPFLRVKELQNGYFPHTKTKRLDDLYIFHKVRFNRSLLGYYDTYGKTKLIWNKLPKVLNSVDYMAIDFAIKHFVCQDGSCWSYAPHHRSCCNKKLCIEDAAEHDVSCPKHIELLNQS